MRHSLGLASLLIVVVASGSSGDTLELKDGTVHRGRKVAESAETIGFKTEGGRLLILQKADVRKLTVDKEPSRAPLRKPARPQRRPAQTAPAKPPSLKGKTISFDFVETPIGEAIMYISAESGVPIELDAERIKGRPTVTLRVKERDLESSLRWLCKLVNLHRVDRDGRVLLTTRQGVIELAEKRRRAYDIRDLLKRRGHTSGHTLVAFIQRTLRPGTWGKEHGTEIRFRDGRLLVQHTEEVHRQIAGLLDGWRHPERGRDTVIYPGRTPLPQSLTSDDPLKGKTVTVDFDQAPLRQAISELSSQTEITIVVDAEALKDAPTVTLEGEAMPLREALDAVCEGAGLRHTLKDGGVFISTPDSIRKKVRLLQYDLRDLVPPLSAERLIDRIKGRIAPQTWNEKEPPRSIAYRNGRLVIVQTAAVHRQIHSFLGELVRQRKRR